MKKFISYGFLVLVLFGAWSFTFAQSSPPTNRIFRKCTGLSTFAEVKMETSGAITASPCAGDYTWLKNLNYLGGDIYTPWTGANTHAMLKSGHSTRFTPPTSWYFTGFDKKYVVNFTPTAPQYGVTGDSTYLDVSGANTGQGVTGSRVFIYSNGTTVTGSPWLTGYEGVVDTTGAWAEVFGGFFAAYTGGAGAAGVQRITGVSGRVQAAYVNVPEIVGVEGQVMVSVSATTQTVANASAVKAVFRGANAGTTVTNLKGVSVGGWDRPLATTVTNLYGVHIDDTIDDMAASNPHAIYSESVAPSYLAGKLTFDKTQEATPTVETTINKPSFSVIFGGGNGEIIVNNSFVTDTTPVLCTVQGNDRDLKTVAVVPELGRVILYGNMIADGDVRVYCEVR